MPLAATLTTEEVYSAFHGTAAEGKTFFHGHTFAGNPLGAAVALASLQVFEDERTLERLAPKIEVLKKRLLSVAELPNVGNIRQKGLIAGIELVADRASQEPFPWTSQIGARVCLEARKHGLLIRPLGDVIVLMPPLSITVEEIVEMVEVVETSIKQVLGTVETDR
jgi:adenosylmethionine-8-amino-7-oxononanoate aminotransferase